MTDHRPPAPGSDPDDPFERELRALLRDRAAGPVPQSLRGAADEAVRTPAAGRFGLAGLRRPLTTLVAAAAAVVLIGASFNPISTVLQAVMVPGASATPGATDPGPTAVVWDNGQVRLEADEVLVTAMGKTFHGGPTSGMDVAGTVLWRQQLRASWLDADRWLSLDLEFRRDEDAWWLSGGSISIADVGSANLLDRSLAGRIGEPMTGDVTLAGDLDLSDAFSPPPDAGQITVTFRGLRLEPFVGIVARTMDGCEPVIDPDHLSVTDALAPGQLLDGVITRGMDTAEAAARLEQYGACYLFERQFGQSSPIELAGTTEIWCDAPDGVVSSARYGPGGEVRLIVTDEAAPDATPRPQPILGWGCLTDPPATVDASIAPKASPSPFTSRSPAPSAVPAIDWDSGEVRLTADALRITAGGQTFTGLVPGVRVGGDPGNATYRTLEVEWQELDREQRLFIYLAADNVSWWITEIRTRDGALNADWATFAPPPFRMPIGGTWRGDLRLAADGATLEIDGMTLRAFSPDTIPAELRLCRPALPAGQGSDITDPLADGQPLAGSGIEQMTPAQAKQLLQSMGLCHLFIYDYQYSDDPNLGFGEIWCDAPPGVIAAVRYGTDGAIRITVRDAVPQLHTPRPQPPVGWGC